MQTVNKVMYQSDSGRRFETYDEAAKDEVFWWLSMPATNLTEEDIKRVWENRSLILQVLQDISNGRPNG